MLFELLFEEALMKYFYIVLAIVLTGCSLPMLQDTFDIDTPKEDLTLSMPAGLLPNAEFLQMKKILAQKGIALSLSDNQAKYFIENLSLGGHYQELYKESVRDALYLDLETVLDIKISEKYSQDVIVENRFTHTERFFPNEAFYSQRDWYKAQLQFESEQSLFEELARHLSKKIKQHAKIS